MVTSLRRLRRFTYPPCFDVADSADVLSVLPEQTPEDTQLQTPIRHSSEQFCAHVKLPPIRP
ncbi:hypothetical protein ACSEOK_26550, partial [Pseudomonas aeruginosa]